MIGNVLEKAMTVRTKVGKRIAKKAESAESVMHFLYGCAVFTELHEGVTIYAIFAFGLGCTAILVAIFHHDAEG